MIEISRRVEGGKAVRMSASVYASSGSCCAVIAATRGGACGNGCLREKEEANEEPGPFEGGRGCHDS